MFRSIPYSNGQYYYYHSDEDHGNENTAHHVYSFVRNIWNKNIDAIVFFEIEFINLLDNFAFIQ